MAYTNIEGREQLLEGVAAAIDQLAIGIAALGVAYERVDEMTADRLEESLFGPLQRALGRAKRTQTEFAARHGLTSREPDGVVQPSPATAAKELIERAAEAAGEADLALATVQDDRAMIEVGDVELRSGIAAVREAIGPVGANATALLRTLGR